MNSLLIHSIYLKYSACLTLIVLFFDAASKVQVRETESSVTKPCNI